MKLKKGDQVKLEGLKYPVKVIAVDKTKTGIPLAIAKGRRGATYWLGRNIHSKKWFYVSPGANPRVGKVEKVESKRKSKGKRKKKKSRR